MSTVHARVGKYGRVTIPSTVREHEGIEHGDVVVLEIEDVEDPAGEAE